jgi:hypothetical protein
MSFILFYYVFYTLLLFVLYSFIMCFILFSYVFYTLLLCVLYSFIMCFILTRRSICELIFSCNIQFDWFIKMLLNLSYWRWNQFNVIKRKTLFIIFICIKQILLTGTSTGWRWIWHSRRTKNISCNIQFDWFITMLLNLSYWRWNQIVWEILTYNVNSFMLYLRLAYIQVYVDT